MHAKDPQMLQWKNRFLVAVACLLLTACGVSRFLKPPIYRNLDESLTIVYLTEHSKKYLNKTIVFSVRYQQKGGLRCPLEGDYVNIILADRISRITLDKVWIRKDKEYIVDNFKKDDTVVVKAKVFEVDSAKNPNLEVLEMVPE